MSKYLYGAAVQGIQNFIFQTNQLSDIVGASELVENICTTLFRELVQDDDYENNSIIHAAGNIKHIFTDEKKCQDIVRDFPRKVVEYAPGITISQAVVTLDDAGTDFDKKVNDLEENLRAQRNKPMASTTIGLMAMHRNRNTGLPAITCVKVKNKYEYWDAATLAKHNASEETTQRLCNDAFGKSIPMEHFAKDIEDITDKNDWIAIIHADGNGLGQIVQEFGDKPEEFKQFSTDLDKNTKAAAVSAYEYIRKEYKLKDKEIIPIRPLVLGGDDFTVICRADLALDYVTKFIEEFESKNKFKGEKKIYELTACAGIAYIKSSFPFYYGYELAESLCSAAKKDTKKFNQECPASCIQFHKVQDSFVEDYQDIIKRELHPTKDISFKFGPYYCGSQPSRWSVSELKECAKELDSNEKEGNAIKSHIRQWLTLIHDGQTGKADQKLWRMKELYCGSRKWLDLINKLTDKKVMRKEKDEKNKEIDVTYYPAYDVLVQHTINTQITIETEDTKRKEETK